MVFLFHLLFLIWCCIMHHEIRTSRWKRCPESSGRLGISTTTQESPAIKLTEKKNAVLNEGEGQESTRKASNKRIEWTTRRERIKHTPIFLNLEIAYCKGTGEKVLPRGNDLPHYLSVLQDPMGKFTRFSIHSVVYRSANLFIYQPIKQKDVLYYKTSSDMKCFLFVCKAGHYL